MYRKLAWLIMLFSVLVCLPLQGLAAVTMSACQSHGHQEKEMHADAAGWVAEHGHDRHHAQSDSACHHQHGDKTPQKPACDNCFNCHLSVGQAIIPSNATVGGDGISVMVSILTAGFTDSYPFAFYHPPRSTSLSAEGRLAFRA